MRSRAIGFGLGLDGALRGAVGGALGLVLAFACGCAGEVGRHGGASAVALEGANAAEEAARAQAFAKEEARAFEQLAAGDPRFARRLGGSASDATLRQATVQALLADDQDAMVNEGTLDFFSFAARARGLDQAAQRIAK